jgi:hypothetical protein
MQLIHLFREYYEPESEPTFPNPLPHLKPDDPRFGDWYDRAEDVLIPYAKLKGYTDKYAMVRATDDIARPIVVPINKLIGTETHLYPDGLENRPDAKSSKLPIVYKVDGNLMVADGNHRVVRAHQAGDTTIQVKLLNVDALEVAQRNPSKGASA